MEEDQETTFLQLRLNKLFSAKGVPDGPQCHGAHICEICREYTFRERRYFSRLGITSVTVLVHIGKVIKVSYSTGTHR